MYDIYVVWFQNNIFIILLRIFWQSKHIFIFSVMRFYVSNIELIDDVLSCNKDVNLTILLHMLFFFFYWCFRSILTFLQFGGWGVMYFNVYDTITRSFFFQLICSVQRRMRCRWIGFFFPHLTLHSEFSLYFSIKYHHTFQIQNT